MPIEVNVTDQNVQVSTSGQTVNASVSGGVGPAGQTGPQGPAGQTGPQGPAGPAGTTTWSGITGKPSTFPPDLTNSVTFTGDDASTGSINGSAAYFTTLVFSDVTSQTSAFTTALRTKLNGIAAGATANATDAQLRDRSTHTGTQAISTLATTGTASASTYLRGDGAWTAISTYTLPAATTSTLGGVIVGTGLGVSSGTASVTYGTTAGTACQGNDSRLSDARTPTSHVHAASDITSGTLATARLGSGTASASTYLRGDLAWSSFDFLPGLDDAADWKARVTAAGGSVSDSTYAAVQRFCVSISASGLRTKMYRLNLFCGSSLTSALVPLYRGPTLSGTQFGNATDTNVLFVSGNYTETGTDGGLLGDGATKYLNTGFAANALPDIGNRHLAAYIRSYSAGSYKTRIGTRDTGDTKWFALWKGAGTQGFSAKDVPFFASFTSTRTGGFLVGTQDAPASQLIYEDDVLQNTLTSGTNITTVSSKSLYIFALNDYSPSSGSPSTFTDERMQGYSIGLNLTAGQVAAYSGIMRAFQASLGRNV